MKEWEIAFVEKHLRKPKRKDVEEGEISDIWKQFNELKLKETEIKNRNL